jgi:cation transport protein ChaC
MLSRESISSGAYLDSFNNLPKDLLWSVERIEKSLAEMLRKRPVSGDIWIFGCGSLIWNPLLDFDRQENATLIGWHRSFCLRIIAGRADPQTPGRMLALEPGGAAEGVAYRLSASNPCEELRMVWIREMVAGSYCPNWVPIKLADQREVMAIIFAADRTRPHYEQDAKIETIAPLIHQASGAHGSNTDYVFRLESALAERGLKDEYVAALASELKRLG